MKQWVLAWVLMVAPMFAGSVVVCAQTVVPRSSAEGPQHVDATLREEAVQTLRDVMLGQEGWVKVHAAEFLLELGYPQGVEEHFMGEFDAHGEQPQYRIGVARVLARVARDPREREHWTGLILDIWMDPAAPDRLHAIEALAKVGVNLEDRPHALALVQAAFRTERGPMRAYAGWVLLNAGDESCEQMLAAQLSGPDVDERTTAAYALRYRESVTPATARLLREATTLGESDGGGGVYVLSAASKHADEAVRASYIRLLVRQVDSGSVGDRYEALIGLAALAGAEDLPRLVSLMNDDDAHADLRAAAAYAICRVGRRQPHRFAVVDWLVIATYGLGMLGAGWFFSRNTRSGDDYLLGGRNMRPWAVGISLFATLLSTLSYLSVPGEVIKHGPMLLGQVLAYPLIALVVCYVLIPYIMRLPITSAYELLETRMGVSVRLLGSLIFLSMRLIWMAVIIYATVTKVLVPLTGMDPAYAPWVCVLMSVVTVVYTAWGGLRAVVWTDVIQSGILFLGAILTLVVISISLGGVSGWWPTQWEPGWADPQFGFDTQSRMTLGWLMLTVFCWYVCTAGSDQMAVQRYLSTRDIPSARKAYVITMATDACVILLLAVLGVALLAYFRAHPYQVPDGQTLASNADTLFPRFIGFALPTGVTGLVVAGLLAAAMSSLSSGLNSSCSVISRDFVDRFRRVPLQGRSQVVLGQLVSVIVGTIVVAITFLVSFVTGNLLEVAFKSVNLLVAPLFVLFFLAMFVPRASAMSAWSAVICSTATAAVIAYWDLLFPGEQGPSFLWILPLSLLVGIAVGTALSFVPFGGRAAGEPDPAASSFAAGRQDVSPER